MTSNPLHVYLTSSICASMITHPIDVLKVRLQTNTGTFPVLKTKLLFKGLRASVLRNGTFVTTKMFTYDFLKDKFSVSSFHEKVICGMSAGLIGAFVGTPFDLIMVRIQNNPEKYPNIYTTIHKTYTNEGFLSFWNGVYHTMNRAVIVTACQFSVYEQLKQDLTNRNTMNKQSVFILSSVSSSIITGILSNPIDLCKTRTMNNMRNNTISHIVKNEGILALWKGSNANICRQIPLNLIRFSFLEFFKIIYSSNQ